MSEVIKQHPFSNNQEYLRLLFSSLHSVDASDSLEFKVVDETQYNYRLSIPEDILHDKDKIRAVIQYIQRGRKTLSAIPIGIYDKYIEIPKEYTSGLHLLLYKDDVAFELKTDIPADKNKRKIVPKLNQKELFLTEEDILKGINLSLSDFVIKPHKLTISHAAVKDNDLIITLDKKDSIYTSRNIYIILSHSNLKHIYISAGKKLKDCRYRFDLTSILNTLKSTTGQLDMYILSNGGDALHELICSMDISMDGENPLSVFKDDSVMSESNYSIRSQLYIKPDNTPVIKRDIISNLIKKQFLLNLRVADIKRRRKKYMLNILASTPYINDVHIKCIYLCLRNKDKYVSIPVSILSTKKSGHTINMLASIDTSKHEFEPFFWDFYADVAYGRHNVGLSKISNVEKLVLGKIYSKMFSYQTYHNDDNVLLPYITKSQELAFMYRALDPFESRYYYAKEAIAYIISRLIYKKLKNKDIWIGFEKLSMSAHESGYYFFEYVHKNNLHKNFYYVIRKDSPEIGNLEDRKDKVLYYKSFKYFLYMFGARLFISSDTRGNSYHVRVKNTYLGREVVNKPLVFLQHGYNGIKRVPDFHKDRKPFDLVIAASEFERNIIIHDWGYSPNEVVTTGLARWDHLKDKEDQAETKQIFVMPTWRTWMDGISKEEFKKSEFYNKYIAFLSSKRLNKILSDNNIKIKFFLHPKFKNYIDLFEINSENIDTFGFLETPLDEMIMKSSLMISDYSSIIWEMFYLGKPCIFYHFDKDKYLKYEGSYMDFNKDLFGDAVYDIDSLIDIIEEYIDTDFVEKDKYHKMRSKYLTYVDNDNSKRIYDAIISNKKYLYSKDKPWHFSIGKIIPFRLKFVLLKIKDGF